MPPFVAIRGLAPLEHGGGQGMNSENYFKNATLLYAEDDPIQAKETVSRLNTLGFSRVLVARDLCEVEELMRDTEVQIALLDVHLGMATTIDVALQLAESGAHIVFTSSYSRDELGDRIGEFAFLPKPFTLSELSEALEDSIDEWPGSLAAE